ncbi:MAG: beta-propeller fold lactonase family protein [Terracidiphilus sp.]|nr:beta-propeller fold lactonase family protein [Terracidiphilus sp.]
MTFNRSSQLVLVSAVSLLAASLLSACGTLTTDFVYVTSAKAAGTNSYGEIDVLEVNSESGKMRAIPTSPFPSEGRNPVSAVASPDYKNLFVANQDDNTIVRFVIGSDGKLYANQTVNTPGIFPVALAAAGSNLFVVDKYQPLPTCSNAAPCSGSVGVFPISSGDVLGSAVANSAVSGSYWPLVLTGSSDIVRPTAVTTASSGAYVYITAYDASATTAVGYIFGFSVGSDGTLTAIAGSPWAAGTKPSGLTASSTGYLYVTDSSNASVLAYSIASGVLTPVSGSPFPTGNGPSAVAVDSTGKYVYVTNASDSNLTAYSASSGVLTTLGLYATGSQPVAIGIDPSLNEYLYTVNFLGPSVSGFQINSSTGALVRSQGSPFGTNAEPTAVAAVPHGAAKK